MRRVLLLLAASMIATAPAVAQSQAVAKPPGVETKAPGRKAKPAAAEAPLVNADNAEAYARHQVFDARMARGDKRALGSICDGCGRTSERRGARPASGSEPRYGGDPAEAPID